MSFDPWVILTVIVLFGLLVPLLYVLPFVFGLSKPMQESIDIQLAPDSDSVCISCSGVDLESTGERTYRCRTCGYEGGSGQALAKEQERIRLISGWSPERRRTALKTALNEARLLLLSAVGHLEAAGRYTLGFVVGPGAEMEYYDDHYSPWRLALHSGQWEFEEARRFLTDARVLSNSAIVLDERQAGDIWDIDENCKQARTLLADLDEALDALDEEEPSG